MKTWLVLIALQLAGIFPLVAKDYLINPENVGLTLPDDWRVLKETDEVFIARAPKRTEFVSVRVRTASPAQKPFTFDSMHAMDLSIVDFVKKQGSVLTFDSETPGKLGGFPCFETRYRTRLDIGLVVYDRDYHLLVNGKIYVLAIQSEKQEDAAMMDKIASSFHFLAPPPPAPQPEPAGIE